MNVTSTLLVCDNITLYYRPVCCTGSACATVQWLLSYFSTEKHDILYLTIDYPFQSLFSVGGISVMYKVQLLGPQNVLHKYEPFLLNPPICMLLYLGRVSL